MKDLNFSGNCFSKINEIGNLWYKIHATIE